MRIIDPGHIYMLRHIDGTNETELRFVKREGENYPGNVGHYEGPNLQEVWRACIDRLKYLDQQIPCKSNQWAQDNLRSALRNLERRAAERHGRPEPSFLDHVELMPVCNVCGHIGCLGCR